MKVRGNFFSPEEVEHIHEMTLKVLDEVGVEMDDDDALQTFREHGARVDGNTVHIPKELFDKALASAPQVVEIHGRNGKSVKIGEGSRVFSAASTPTFLLGADGRRRLTSQDFRNFCRLDHTSEVINLVNGNYFEPDDIDPEMMKKYQIACALKTTDKPIIGVTTSPQVCEDAIEMAQRFYGYEEDRTVLLGICNPMSPLKYNHSMLFATRYYAQHNQAVCFPSCSMPGVTSPVTISGTIVVNNAEIMAGVVYAQLVQPGAPVIYANTSCTTDMRYVTSCIGAPETGLISFASAAMAQYYKIPCRTSGSLTDAKCIDWQAGAEATMVMLSGLMSTNNFFLHSCGIMDSFNSVSYEKYLLDEQNIKAMLFLTDGIEVHTDMEEIENIRDVGPGGDYLVEDHTLENMAYEIFQPVLSNKMGYASWEEAGKEDAYELAHAEVIKRLGSYAYPEMEPEREAVLKEYVGELYDGM